MCCGITGEGRLMVRVGPDVYEEVIGEPHVSEMDFTGRPLKGMVYIDSAAISTKPALKRWVQRGIDFAGALPAKRKR